MDHVFLHPDTRDTDRSRDQRPPYRVAPLWRPRPASARNGGWWTGP